MSADRLRGLSRRDFFKLGGGLVLGVLGASTRRALAQDVDPTPVPTTPDSSRSWTLRDAVGRESSVSLPEGFTPDSNLRTHTTPDTGFSGGNILPLPGDTRTFADFQRVLNTAAGGRPVLAGYDPSIELGDYCSNPPSHECTAQSNMFGWKVFTGEEMRIPGIGRLEGGPGRAVMVLVLNRDGSVFAWDEAPVMVKHGFTGGGPIWDGERNIDLLEQGLAAHYIDRLHHGIDGMYQGACDNPDNCGEVLVVSVQRRQFGNNADGSPRRVFELLRAELVAKTIN